MFLTANAVNRFQWLICKISMQFTSILTFSLIFNGTACVILFYSPSATLPKQLELNIRSFRRINLCHYNDVIMGTIASQITSLTIVYSIVYPDADQRKHQSSASLAFVWGIHRGPVNSPHKWPVTRKMFPFDDVIMVIVLTTTATRKTRPTTFSKHFYL